MLIGDNNVECLHRWFERSAVASPNAPALTCNAQTLSYAEVNRRANQIAHHLISCGVGPDVLVGICIDRSLDLVLGILGILKAGGAYLPIDLSYPTDRLAFMLEDAQAPVLLTEKKLVLSLPTHRARTICLDDAETRLANTACYQSRDSRDAGTYGLRDLHLGFHWPAEGLHDHAPERRPPHALYRTLVRV